MIRDLLKRVSKLPIPMPLSLPTRLLGFIRRFGGRKLNAAGLVFLTAVTMAALLADVLASSTPIAFSLNSQVHVLPVLFKPDNMDNLDNHAITKAIESSGGWALLPPIPYDPNQTKVAGNISWLESPSGRHLLGTDDKGRDVLARIIHGARSALLVGLGSVSLYLLVAIFLGAVAGYFGGFVDRIALRLIETLTSFPTFFLILTLQGLLGATSVAQLVLVIGLTRWTDVASLTRAEVMRVANEDYVTAARALGLGHPRILLKHVLPGAMAPALVAATFGVAGAILIESTLSFLGFGVPSTTSSWGQLLTDAFQNEGCYWLAIFPGMVLFLTILSINIVGEGLREALDPSS
ncbi:MAG: ABC transporter permease [Deltaproteobacteria bacterium]|nr:ABC transporter permease [Deltaproteobacteria bacterium]